MDYENGDFSVDYLAKDFAKLRKGKGGRQSDRKLIHLMLVKTIIRKKPWQWQWLMGYQETADRDFAIDRDANS